MKECPNCKLVSPESAEHCDCGYDFATGSMQSSAEANDRPEKKEPTDYTGLIFAAILAPVFLLFIYFGKADTGLAVFIVLGMIMFAIKIRRNLRKHVWFWATVGFILALHVPLVLIARWPQGKVPTIAYTMPVAIADFFIILGAIGLAEKVFSKNSPSNDKD